MKTVSAPREIHIGKVVDGRNTEDIALIMALSSLDELPEIRKAGQDGDDFARGLFDGLQVDLFLTSNPLFDQVRRRYATRQRIDRFGRFGQEFA